MLELLSQGLNQLIDLPALRMLEDFLYNTPKKTIGVLEYYFEVKAIDIKLKKMILFMLFLILIYFRIIGYLLCSFRYYETCCR